MNLIFKTYRAIDNPDLCRIYMKGHEQVLIDYGIQNVTSNNDKWMLNSNVYCVFALTKENSEMVGGIRVQVSDNELPLPIETAIGHMDAAIYKIVTEFRNSGGVGELCGLWNSKKVAGIGVSYLLVRAAIASAIQLNFQTLIGICAEYSFNMFYRVGFRVNTNLGMEGKFPYPNNNYVAKVLGIMNAITLETAADYDKERMQSLRKKLIQSCTENEGKCDINVSYDLEYKLKK